MWGLYVAPEARGQRLGQRLVGALIDHARAQPGITVIELTVMAANAPALALYREFGFRRFGYQERAARIGDAYFAEEHLMFDLDG